MFLEIINGVIQLVDSGTYQIDSQTEQPILLERYEIVSGVISPVAKYVGQTNQFIYDDIASIESLMSALIVQGEAETALLAKLRKIEKDVCKLIVGKEYLSDSDYDYLISNYERKYQKALAGEPMPLQASQIGITTAELNTMIIAKRDAMVTSQDALFDVLEAKRLELTTLLKTNDFTAYYSAVSSLDSFPKEFMASLLP